MAYRLFKVCYLVFKEFSVIFMLLICSWTPLLSENLKQEINFLKFIDFFYGPGGFPDGSNGNESASNAGDTPTQNKLKLIHLTQCSWLFS